MGQRKLSGEWTNLFFRQGEENKSCLCTVLYIQPSKTQKSRKDKAWFFTGKAVCTFTGCSTFIFKIEKDLKPGQSVSVIVRLTSEVIHPVGELHARFCSGKCREEVAKAALELGSSELYHSRLASMTDTEIRSGNTSRCTNPKVIRKIVSQHQVKDRLDQNMFLEVQLIAEVFGDEDFTNMTVPSYVQHVAIFPFTVHMYTEGQLHLFQTVVSIPGAAMYFDAIFRAISKQKRVFYYPLVGQGAQGEPPIPGPEMITTLIT